MRTGGNLPVRDVVCNSGGGGRVGGIGVIGEEIKTPTLGQWKRKYNVAKLTK